MLIPIQSEAIWNATLLSHRLNIGIEDRILELSNDLGSAINDPVLLLWSSG